jgi:polar amino acid transport system ATP-binding protein
MVFQQFNLYPHLTVLQNVMEAPVGVHGRSRPEAEREALALLVRVGLFNRPLQACARRAAGSV